MKLEGTITDGRLVCDQVIWAIAMREFNGHAVVIEIDRKRARRSNRANARYWTVLVPLARHALNLKRGSELLPLNKDQVHYLLVTAFAGSEETELGAVAVHTSTMDTKQFHHFTEQVALWLREQGYAVPEGPEVSVAEVIEEAMQ
jgi:hypothetical protein